MAIIRAIALGIIASNPIPLVLERHSTPDRHTKTVDEDISSKQAFPWCFLNNVVSGWSIDTLKRNLCKSIHGQDRRTILLCLRRMIFGRHDSWHGWLVKSEVWANVARKLAFSLLSIQILELRLRYWIRNMVVPRKLVLEGPFPDFHGPTTRGECESNSPRFRRSYILRLIRCLKQTEC